MNGPVRTLTAAAVVAAVAIGCVVLPGCGSRKVDVKGKVTYQGKTVVKGSVTLVASDGLIYVGQIGEDGTYTISGVPSGVAQVGVTSPAPPGNKPSMAREGGEARGSLSGVGKTGAAAEKAAPSPAAPAGWFPLPPQFIDPATSGVSVDVGKGEANIDLK